MLAGLAVVLLMAVGIYAMCVAAGRADREATELARRAGEGLGEPTAGEVAELLLPWPGTELLAAVRREFPHLPDELVYSVAQARGRLGRRTPGALG